MKISAGKLRISPATAGGLILAGFVLASEITMNRIQPPMRFGTFAHGMLLSAVVAFWLARWIFAKISKPYLLISAFIYLNAFYYIFCDLYLSVFGDFPSIRMLSMLLTAIQFTDSLLSYLSFRHLAVFAYANVAVFLTLLHKKYYATPRG
jgi:hypothetical protein